MAQICEAPIVGKHLFVSLGTVLEYDSGANQTVMNLSEVFGEIFRGAGDFGSADSAGKAIRPWEVSRDLNQALQNENQKDNWRSLWLEQSEYY